MSMEKIFVADSYKDMQIISEPFENEKGRLFVKVKAGWSDDARALKSLGYDDFTS